MATLGLSKVFILDKYFTELQKFWETEKKLQGEPSAAAVTPRLCVCCVTCIRSVCVWSRRWSSLFGLGMPSKSFDDGNVPTSARQEHQ
ncbi:hypothetical protein JYU34_021470 [Plutella xylostella]|uniref:Uncharacterized protein n=1 Tax=Plutella xylostella TaxID=51655 RepID=A0ABQ7PTM2_PLUXY|nr:hypothetical protein JYU34_021470 [Plutella xylostella]